MSNETKKGRSVYNSTVLHAKRDKRRREAKDRQRTYDRLTVEERIALVKSRRGKSKRELGRLMAALKPKKN